MKNNIMGAIVSILLIGCTWPIVSSAQDDRGINKAKGTEIKKFSAGKALTTDDIAFLDGIENRGVKSRGNPVSVVIDGKKYALGQRLNQEDEKIIESKLTAYAKDHPHKANSVSRGSGPACDDDCECCLECDGRYLWRKDKDGNCICTCLERRNPKISQGNK